MTRYHATANGNVPFTPEEEAEWDAREAAQGTFAAKKAAKKLALAAMAKNRRNAQITSGGVTVSIADPDALALLTGAKQGGKPTRKIVATSGRHELTKVQFDALVGAIDDYLQGIYDNHYDKDAAIDAAADESALNAIDMNAGWPA